VTEQPSAPAAPHLEPLTEDFERVLCVAAHPDDLEYGTSAAVDRWTKAGKTVTYLLVTRGEAGIDAIAPEEAAPLRAQEERDGAAEVGVDVVEFLDYDDGVVVYSAGLRRDIARVIRHRRPDLVVTGSHEEVFPGGRTNQADHRAVGLAALDATRDAGNRWIFRDLCEVEGLQPWSGVKAVLMAGSTQPTHFVDVADHVEPAIASLEAHHLYNSNLSPDFPAPRELVTWILGMGGQAVGLEHAVTFRRYDV
jgi:LmbE family N-acetylglucosaminyl deacetylase